MKYYLFVLGCAMNHSDAERISSVLGALGYKETKAEREADVIITVACSVRQTAIDRIYGKIKRWQKLKQEKPTLKTVLTGCVLDEDRLKMSKTFDEIIGIDEINRLPEALGHVVEVEPVERLGKSGEYLGLVPTYSSDFRAFVPIMTGCNNYCSYCAVPYTRGPERSRSREEVLKEIKILVSRGYREITLLGQNVNSYQYGFVALLEEIDQIKGDFRVYFYSNHPKDMSPDLVGTLPLLKHFPHYVHLPLQSGNNEILQRMNRHYTKDSYLDLVGKLRSAMPDVTLTTDIIVGFPGETLEAFEETREVMEKASFDMAYIAQYSPRPGSLSAKIVDDIPKAEKKRREKELLGVLSETAHENNQKLVGKKLTVLIDEEKNGKFYGRSEGYKVVEVNVSKNNPSKTTQSLNIGHFCEVTITDAGPWKLLGTF